MAHQLARRLLRALGRAYEYAAAQAAMGHGEGDTSSLVGLAKVFKVSKLVKTFVRMMRYLRVKRGQTSSSVRDMSIAREGALLLLHPIVLMVVRHVVLFFLLAHLLACTAFLFSDAADLLLPCIRNATAAAAAGDATAAAAAAEPYEASVWGVVIGVGSMAGWYRTRLPRRRLPMLRTCSPASTAAERGARVRPHRRRRTDGRTGRRRRWRRSRRPRQGAPEPRALPRQDRARAEVRAA